MIQRVKKPIKFFWMSSAAVIIVFAVLLQLTKWSLPYINYFNHSLESHFSRQINAQVRVERISAAWTGLRPKVMVDELSIKTEEGELLLAINNASMRLDILRSLYHWTPVWHSVEAKGVELSVSQNESGAWSIGGMSPTNKGRGWRYRSPSALFLMAGDVSLESSKVNFTLHNQRQVDADIPLISIQNNGHFHRLNAKAAIGNNSSFNFILEGVGDPSIPDQFFAQAYLQLNRFPVERLSQLFEQVAVDAEMVVEQPESFEATKADIVEVSESEANLNMWLDFASPSRFLLKGDIELLNDESTPFAKKYYLDIPVSANISGDYSIQRGLTLGLSKIQIDKTLFVDKAHIKLHDNKVKAAIDKIDLSSWTRWAEKRLVRSKKVNAIINALAPAGELHNFYSSIDLLDTSNSLITANVSNAQSEAWQGLPEFRNVSGYIESNLKQGFILLDADDFSFFPDKVYNVAVESTYSSGYVGWQLNPKNNTAKVDGFELKMLGDFGEANGNFSLGLNLDKSNSNDPGNLTLQIGLKKSNALFHQQLVPKLLPKDLLRWMSESIKAGEVSEAGFFYRGGLDSDSKRTVQFFADLEKGELDFSSDWPSLKNLKGRFIVDNKRVSGKVNDASIYGRDQFKGFFDWNKNNRKALSVSASGVTSAQSGLRYLRESWLKTKVGTLIDQVSGKGKLNLDVDLLIPFDGSSVSSRQDVNIIFNDNQLLLNELDLVLNSVKGELNYSSGRGFLSRNLSGSLFGQPVTADVRNDRADKNSLQINGLGSVAVSSIAEWLDQPILSYTSGALDYQLNIRVPSDDSEDRATISVQSNLLGVSATLPPPFNKKSDQELPFLLSIPIKENSREYKLTLGQYFSGHFVAQKDNPLVATVALSDIQFPEFTSLPDKGLKLVSQFENLNANLWLDFIKKYPRSKEVSNYSVDALISVDNFTYNDFQLKNMMMSGHREKNGWSLFVDSNDVLGGVYIDDDERRPLVVDIDYLNWPPDTSEKSQDVVLGLEENETVAITDDLMRDIDPRELPLADININRLVYKDKPLGNWSMQLRPDDVGLLVDNIVATVNGFVLAGDPDKEGASLRWLAKSESLPASTQFNGVVFGDNPKALFEQWGLPFGLESEKTRLNADLFWTGSPAAFAVEKLNGKVSSQHLNGIFTQDKANDATGMLRLFGLFNFDSWARRVRLDFSDVYKKGIVFDELKGSLSFKEGLITISDPITMKGPSSKMSLSGLINYPEETVDARLVATVPIGGNLTVVAALAGGLPAAAGVYLVSKLFEKQVEKVSSVNYVIRGDWAEPVISVDKVEGQSVSQDATADEEL